MFNAMEILFLFGNAVQVFLRATGHSTEHFSRPSTFVLVAVTVLLLNHCCFLPSLTSSLPDLKKDDLMSRQIQIIQSFLARSRRKCLLCGLAHSSQRVYTKGFESEEQEESCGFGKLAEDNTP